MKAQSTKRTSLLTLTCLVIAVSPHILQSTDSRIPSCFKTPFNIPRKTSSQKDARRWDCALHLYTRHIKNEPDFANAPRTPKIIHQICLDGPLPKKYHHLQESFLEKHPDWHYKLWTDKDIQELILHNKDAYDAATTNKEKNHHRTLRNFISYRRRLC